MTAPPPKLLAEWYAKLRASGFEDIELPDGSLRRSDGQKQADSEANWPDREQGEKYYRTAQALMHTPGFSKLTRVRRWIWGQHAEGATNADIAAQFGVTIKAVRVTIRLCRRMAGLPDVSSTIGHGR